ncbi:protein mono-ADP-ribosyltransferase PARP9-like isoform X2 [Periophthalmus magnuspinnatus]|uniref:protein mono-ADP-ribosyltransferase PARP9-like isoform X2 n=1 Tax=Periophthalmus magnuspinnatus TaxID=409849 RepID=UPI00145C129C|nr:protein mono-ADP-ribosyltransferase PARP9-like isoform X2 [Periophthalmus magnuspinnatus]
MASNAPPPHTLDLALSGPSLHVARSSAQILLDLLRTRFHCEAQILGVDLTSNPGLRPHVAPEKRFEHILPSGVRVSVWKGDLANFSAEAVVNAANSQLHHAGGLALALAEAGGPQIQKESDDYVRTSGNVRTGEAVALGAGKLQCKAVIHAVGPQLSFRPTSYEVSVGTVQLERTIRSVLEIVEEKKFNTVAIPAISSGIFNFPLAECADVIVNTVMKFYGSILSHRFKPKEVLLVNIDDPTVQEMALACVRLMSPVPPSYSQVAGVAPQTRRAAKGAAPPPQVQLGAVCVILRKGRLEEEKTDVIVNTIGTDRKLSTGQVSRELLRKAGNKMQQEIYGAPYSGCVIITKGFKLSCKEVYHTCCPYKQQHGSDQALFTSVRDCLWNAVSSKHSSIAFPAIGTGNLGFKDTEVAQLMLNAVCDFTKSYPPPLNVHFVIFPSDVDRFKAFEKELRSLQTNVSQMSPPHNFSQGAQNFTPALPPKQASAASHGDRPEESPVVSPEPRLLLQSSSEENVTEARAWVTSLLHNKDNKVWIYNNFTQHLGDKQLQDLSNMEVYGVEVEELLEKGCSGFMVSGNRAEDIALTALTLEQKIQEAQMEYEDEEREELRRLTRRSQSPKGQTRENRREEVRGERSRVSRGDSSIKHLVEQLRSFGMETVKVERVKNPALERLFKLQKAQMPSHSSQTLLQLVSAQFCDTVGHIGFRPECAPPDDPSLGEGLYSSSSPPPLLLLSLLSVFQIRLLVRGCTPPLCSSSSSPPLTPLCFRSVSW